MVDPDLLFEVFARALELPPQERKPWLKQNYGHDRELLKEVVSLFENMGSDPFGEIPYIPSIEIGEKIRGYEVKALLGSGLNGDVFKVVHPKNDKLLYAFKFLEGQDGREIDILADMEHPNIVNIWTFGTHDDGLGERTYIVMKYIKSPDVDHVIPEITVDHEKTTITQDDDTAETDNATDDGKRKESPLDLFMRWAISLEPKTRIDVFKQICLAVQALHEENIIHCDIKPNNILVDRGVPKLADFGISTSTGKDGNKYSHIGALTPRYAAPSQFQAQKEVIVADASWDIYALGVLCFEMFADGKWPYNDGDYKGLLQNVPQGKKPRAVCDHITTHRPTPLESYLGPNPPKHLKDIALLVRACMAGTIGIDTLVADLQNVLDEKPISLRKADKLHTLECYVRRHPWRSAFLATAVLVFLFLSNSVIGNWKSQLLDKRASPLIQKAQETYRIKSFDQGRLKKELVRTIQELEGDSFWWGRWKRNTLLVKLHMLNDNYEEARRFAHLAWQTRQTWDLAHDYSEVLFQLAFRDLRGTLDLNDDAKKVATEAIRDRYFTTIKDVLKHIPKDGNSINASLQLFAEAKISAIDNFENRAFEDTYFLLKEAFRKDQSSHQIQAFTGQLYLFAGYYKRGIGESELGDFRNAAEYYQRSVKLAPGYAPALLGQLSTAQLMIIAPGISDSEREAYFDAGKNAGDVLDDLAVYRKEMAYYQARLYHNISRYRVGEAKEDALVCARKKIKMAIAFSITQVPDSYQILKAGILMDMGRFKNDALPHESDKSEVIALYQQCYDSLKLFETKQVQQGMLQLSRLSLYWSDVDQEKALALIEDGLTLMESYENKFRIKKDTRIINAGLLYRKAKLSDGVEACQHLNTAITSLERVENPSQRELDYLIFLREELKSHKCQSQVLTKLQRIPSNK